jgi:hypothetical protein
MSNEKLSNEAENPALNKGAVSSNALDLIDKRFEDCEKLAEKFDGENLMSLLLAATYIGQTYEINKDVE